MDLSEDIEMVKLLVDSQTSQSIGSVASLDDLWKQQLKADFPESSRDEQMGLSREDRHFMDLVTKSAKLMNGHYSIGLPLRKRDASIPNNRRVSQQRALSLKRKYDKVA